MKVPSINMLFFAAFFGLLCSCSNDDSKEAADASLAGEYKLVAMTADINVDLNNDGVLSNNLLDETDPAFFSGSASDLTIESAILDNKMVPLMSFYLPHPKLTFGNTGKVNVAYSRRGLGYEYNFNAATNQITVDKDDSATDPFNSGTLQDVALAGDETLRAVFKKYYYDFEVSGWQELNITCIYIKK